jgi:hypothetical protein
MLVALLSLIVQTASQSDEAVLLSVSNDTAFILPLSSIRRTVPVASATLVSVYDEAGESWEEVRRDAVVEIDCLASRWRFDREARTSRDGAVRVQTMEATPWEAIPTDYPPAVALEAILCDGLDPTVAVIPDWEHHLTDLRAMLD